MGDVKVKMLILDVCRSHGSTRWWPERDQRTVLETHANYRHGLFRRQHFEQDIHHHTGLAFREGFCRECVQVIEGMSILIRVNTTAFVSMFSVLRRRDYRSLQGGDHTVSSDTRQISLHVLLTRFFESHQWVTVDTTFENERSGQVHKAVDTRDLPGLP